MNTPTKIFRAIFLSVSVLLYSCHEEEVVRAPENKLVAVAGPDQAVKRNEQVSLDASGSRDGNNKPFSILWSIKTKPVGSSTSIETPGSVSAAFVPDLTGIYVVGLTISQSNWTASDELIVTVTAAEPEGPETVLINEDISSNRTLIDIFDDASAIDYLVTDDVDVRAELIVMPGVVIAFAENKGLQIVTGFIRAKGTGDHKIVFKGLDNRPAFWKGILIYSNSEFNELEHVVISDGGSSVFAESGIKANLAVSGTAYSGGAVRVSQTLFSGSGGYGLYVQGMSSLNLFSSNSFADNASTPAYIPAHQLHKIDPDNVTGNTGLTEIETGGSLLTEEEVTWNAVRNGAYRVTSHITVKAGVTVAAGATFKMKEGITLETADQGYLKALGTETSRIVFTSSSPSTYWNGLHFNSYNANNKVAYCDISNAGFNKIAGSEHAGNIVLGYSGMVTIENSAIRNGLGYGVVAKVSSQVNQSIATVNTFTNLAKGVMFPEIPGSTERPAITGVWLDEWSFRQGFDNLQDDFYNQATQTWFGGAANPWATGSEKGMGIRFDESANFTWLIAEHSPWTGCESYSAEYITGTATVDTDVITFEQNYWRSKFVNSCDPGQNVDTGVTPATIPLRYTTAKLYDLFTGEAFWELKFINPDNSTFSFYRR